ncbi:MAG: sigma-70 family RNA polymerase sigma factor [Kiritimatiellae bacterium]|nr:sigma-70 family RNA polymerase sigma factor [Kiritimatiellia bacterium]
MEIWQEIRRNSDRGAERLVSEYGNRLYAAALLLCSNSEDAEDLTFRTLNQAIRKIKTFDPSRNFYTWLYTILLNFRRMDLRRKRTSVISVGSTADLPEVAIECFAEKLECSGNDQLSEALKALSPQLREAVVLRYYDEKTIDEIAAILQVPPGTVKSRLHNARIALNTLLSGKEP